MSFSSWASWVWGKICAARDAIYFFLIGKPFPGSSQEKRAAAQEAGGAKGTSTGDFGAGRVMNAGLYANGRPSPGAAGGANPGLLPVDVKRLNYVNKVSSFAYGQPCMIEYFGTHCPACRQAAPSIASLARRYPQAYVVGVSGDSEDQIRDMLSAVPAMKGYNVARDNGDVQNEVQRYGVHTIPHAFVYGADGHLIWEGHPESGAEQAIKQAVAALQDGASSWGGSGRRL